MEKGIHVNLRMRFTCTVYRNVKKNNKNKKINNNHNKDNDNKKIIHSTSQASETFEILNDLVVDRGSGPYMSLLELFGK